MDLNNFFINYRFFWTFTERIDSNFISSILTIFFVLQCIQKGLLLLQARFLFWSCYYFYYSYYYHRYYYHFYCYFIMIYTDIIIAIIVIVFIMTTTTTIIFTAIMIELSYDIRSYYSLFCCWLLELMDNLILFCKF